MSRIRVLDEATVNKIAAGEVIERPASVVKELVENSLDAGATEVRVRVGKAGKALIEVADNGCGMAPEDLPASVLQHATSKMRSIDDLEAIRTMGFRGEALSSIAAVADVEISSREEGAEAGTSVRVSGGKTGRPRSVGRPRGTTVTVERLFAGHPARLKYLKSDRVELAHIADVISERALANPGVLFSLDSDGEVLLILPPCGSVRDRIADVMGLEVARALSSFSADGEGFRIEAHLAKPEVTRSTRSGLHIFVNARPVSSQTLAEAVEAGFGGMLMRNRHPVGVLLLDVDPSRMDVNVHPTKRTVKFEDERPIAEAVSSGTRAMLAGSTLVREAQPLRRAPAADGPAGGAAEQGRAWHPLGEAAVPETRREAVQTRLAAEPGAQHAAREVPEGRTMPAMRVIGQVLDTYILAQSGPDLLIIDQHAAHERVMLDRLRSRPERKAGQKLISPVPVKVDGKEAQLIEHHREAIEGLGFIIEPFGRDTYLVRGVPSVGGRIETESGLLDLVRELAELGKAKSLGEAREELMHLVACHSAIRAGEPLPMDRMVRLVEEMKALDNPFSCAHGRPTIIKITRKELEKMFRRSL